MSAPVSASPGKKLFKWAYLLVLLILVFTGFGQMPIFKRYYLADIPGLGWTADFYTTHMIHYIGASLLLGLIAYATADFLLSKRRDYSLSGSAYVRMILLAGLVGTGILRVFKNLPDVTFSPDFTLVIDISHLALTVLFLFSALLFMFLKKAWTVNR
jgi:heme A synthase